MSTSTASGRQPCGKARVGVSRSTHGPSGSNGTEPPDLRLVGLALGAWAAALAGLHVSALAGLIVAAVAGAAAGCLVVAGRGLWLVAAGVLLGACAGAAVTAARVAERDAQPLAALAAARATVRAELVVTDDPRLVGGARVTVLVAARLRHLDAGTGRIRHGARILVLASDPGWRQLLPGQRVAAEGRLDRARGGDLTAAVLAATGPPHRLGRPPLVQRAAGRLRDGLQRACEPLPDDAGGLLPGLVIGDTSRLPPAVAEDFKATGLTHLVAVSGANCLILTGAVLLLARYARAGPRLSAVLSAVALAGFVILARPSPSVLRAAVMGVVALLALAVGRTRAAVPALATAVLVLILVDPALAGAPGFALSVVATGGLILLAPSWRDALRRRGVPAGIAEALAVPAAAQAACAPVIAGNFGTVSLTAVPANLLAVPAVAPATVLGVLAAVVSPVWTDAAELLAWLGSWPARFLVWVARVGARVPAGTLPWPSGTGGGMLLAGLLALGIYAGRFRRARQVALVCFLATVLGAAPVKLFASGWPPPDWIVVACAVGQGDAVVLPAGRGRAIVVDAGPEPAATDRCLRRLGIDEVAMLVVTHFHVDHTGGLDGVRRGRSVAAVAIPAFEEPAAGRRAVQEFAAAARAPVLTPAAGWTVRLGPTSLALLALPGPLHGTRSDANNNSVVAVATVRGRTVLLAADAEVEQQESLLREYGAGGLRADVLKVAHHGSAFQDPAFLDAVRPAVALVSVGAGNGYGHPNAAVLDRLGRSGARVLRTDREGDVAVVVRDGRLAVVARGREPGAAAVARWPGAGTPDPPGPRRRGTARLPRRRRDHRAGPRRRPRHRGPRIQRRRSGTR